MYLSFLADSTALLDGLDLRHNSCLELVWGVRAILTKYFAFVLPA